MKNKKVKENLERLFLENYNKIRNLNFQLFMDNLIQDDSSIFNMNLGKITSLFDSKEIKRLKVLKGNNEFSELFNSILEFNFDEAFVLKSFKKNIVDSLNEIKSIITNENINFKNQIILLEYDYEPIVSWSGFGEGDYPVLEFPKYFNFNYKEEIYYASGEIDYSPIWGELHLFKEKLEELNLENIMWDSELFPLIENAVIYKTYLLLHEAFNESRELLLNNLPCKLPLFIYGNEHDCEAMNIFILE